MSLENKYLNTLLKLLPRGKLWRSDEDSGNYKLLGGISVEAARVDRRIAKLELETDPHTADETFEDWETDYGMSKTCGGLSATIPERRADLIAKIVSFGGQSKDYFLSFFDASDGDVTISYPESLSVVGVSVGVHLDHPNRSTWRVNLPNAELEYFTAGSMAGTPLVRIKHTVKMCLIQKYKPTNTHVYFTNEA